MRIRYLSGIVASIVACGTLASFNATSSAVEPATEETLSPLEQAPPAANANAADPTDQNDGVLRTPTATVVRDDEGVYTATITASEVNGQDGDGEWLPSHPELVNSDDPQFEAESTGTSSSVQIPSDPERTPVRIESGDEWVEMLMDGLSGAPEISEDTAVFESVKNAHVVEYSVNSDGVKEEIILATAPQAGADLLFNYRIEASPGLEFGIGIGGNIDVLRSDGSVAFTIPPGVMVDSAGTTSGAVDYSLSVSSDGHTQLEVDPSDAWLHSSDRQYPVNIDPSISPGPTRDCMLRSHIATESACANGSQYLRVGRKDSQTRFRTVLDFDLSSIPDGAHIVGSAVSLYLDSTQTFSDVETEYGIFKAGKDFNYPTWNRSVGSSGAAGDAWAGGDPFGGAQGEISMKGNTSGTKTFAGLKSWMQSFVDDRTTWDGLVLKQVAETSNNVLAFYSSNSMNPAGRRPKLSVEFTVPPPPTDDIPLISGTNLSDISAALEASTGVVSVAVQVNDNDDWLTVGVRIEGGPNARSRLRAEVAKAIAGMPDIATVEEPEPGEPANVTDPPTDPATINKLLTSITAGTADIPQLTTTASDKARFASVTETVSSSAPLPSDPKAEGYSSEYASEAAASGCSPNDTFKPKSRMLYAYMTYDTPTETYQPYAFMKFRWGVDRLTALLCGRSNNVTYEHDFQTDNRDGKHYYNDDEPHWWSSTMPDAYLDTQLFDGDDILVYTVGTSDASKLRSGKNYKISFKTILGNEYENDSAALAGQVGKRRPSVCHSKYCIFGVATQFIKSQWTIKIPKIPCPQPCNII